MKRIESITKPNLDRVVKNKNDTKLSWEIETLQDLKGFQEYLDKIVGWVETWQMRFNTEKCSHASGVKKYRGKIYSVWSGIKGIKARKGFGDPCGQQIKWQQSMPGCH